MNGFDTAIIGGGAAGMTAAVLLARSGHNVAIVERGDRLGRKLSATGNGMGNVTNVNTSKEHYFSDDPGKVGRVLARCGWRDTVRFLESMGGIFLPDGRGRVYPAGRQASAVTDLFRRELSRLGVRICLSAQVNTLTYDGYGGLFRLGWGKEHLSARTVLLAAGGKAAKNFGTDGSAYALAAAFGHTVSALSPVLVQLRTDPARVRGLKGIRTDALLSVLRGGRTVCSERGDVLFTESGVSGDAVFRASSRALAGDELAIDFLPDVPAERLAPFGGEDGLLCVVNNGLARFLRREGGSGERALALVKNFRIPVTGTLGFDYAQATRGGIPLSETDEDLMSVKRAGLFFAGEILHTDGECGGYNLQWAFASAHAAAEGICRF